MMIYMEYYDDKYEYYDDKYEYVIGSEKRDHFALTTDFLFIVPG